MWILRAVMYFLKAVMYFSASKIGAVMHILLKNGSFRFEKVHHRSTKLHHRSARTVEPSSKLPKSSAINKKAETNASARKFWLPEQDSNLRHAD